MVSKSSWLLRASLVVFIALAPRQIFAVPLDFDGDGISDLFGFENQRDGSANELAYRILRSSDQIVMKVELGNADDAAVPADYDGDGFSDLGFVKLEADNTLSWNLRLSGQSNQITSSVFGLLDDMVLSGCDVDGDSKADKIVLRGTDALVEKSSDSTTATVALGVSPDHVICGERDGVAGDEIIINYTSGSGSAFSSYNLSGQKISEVSFGSKVVRILALDTDGDGIDEIAYLKQGGTRLYAKVGDSTVAVKLKKSLSITSGRYILGSTIDGIAAKIDRNYTFIQISAFGGVASSLAIDDTTTLLPAVRLQSVGPRRSRESICTEHLDPYDGPNGFLFKPVSDSNRCPAVLLPQGIRGGKVRFMKNGRVLETLRYGGNGNGGRDHFRSSKSASSLPFETTVTQKRGATVRCWLLDDPTVRTD